MKIIKIALLLIFGPSVCPFWAYAQFIDGPSRPAFLKTSNSGKAKSLQELLDSQETTLQNKNINSASKELIQSLRKNSKSLEKQSLGGVSDGGSTGIYVGNRLILLDLYIVKPRLEQARGSRLIVQDSKVIFKEKPHFKVVVKDQPAFKTAIQLLASSSLPKTVQAVIADALTEMEFSVSDADLPLKRASVPDWLSARISSERLKTIAMYSPEDRYGLAVIVERYWIELGALSQAGVLIHEALRHIQFVDEDSKMINRLSDAILQDLTAQVVLKVPPSSKSAEIGWFLNTAMNNRFEKSQEIASGVCATLRHQFPMATVDVQRICESPLPKDELARASVLNDLAGVLTNALPEMLVTEKAKEFMRTRDEAVLLSLDYSRAVHLKSKYDFIRLKAYEQSSISDD